MQVRYVLLPHTVSLFEIKRLVSLALVTLQRSRGTSSKKGPKYTLWTLSTVRGSASGRMQNAIRFR